MNTMGPRPSPRLLVYLTSTTRNFSKTSSHWRGPTRSPRVIRKEKAIERGSRPPTTPPKATAGLQWPVELLQDKESKPVISREHAVSVLDGFVALKASKGLGQKHVEAFVEEHGITPSVLSTLGNLLLRAGDQQYLRVAKGLLVAASSLDDEDATLNLMEEALKHDKREHLEKSSVQGARAHLERLVKARNPAAMLLAAKQKELEGKTKEALELYQSATRDSETKGSSGDDEVNSIPGEAWESVGRLMGKMNMPAEEEKATERAAVVHDNPEAYHTLASKFRQPHENQYLEFMLKAAVSGIGNAAYRVGLCYLVQAESLSNAGRVDFRLAREWFKAAAESPTCHFQALAKLHVARVFHKEGNSTGAMQLLEEAAQTSSVASDTIAWLRSCWDGHDSRANNMTSLEFEAFINGESKKKV